MRKAVLRGAGCLEIVETEMPSCREGGAVVKVEACAICGTDVESFIHGQRMAQLPPQLGHELSGVVVSLSHGVDLLSVGDRVVFNQSVPCGECADCGRGYENLCDRTIRVGGGFAEYIEIPPFALQRGNLLKMPDALSFRAATLTEALAAVVNGQDLLDITLGDTVLVIGAGAVGCLHGQLAKVRGATKVIQADIKRERLEAARDVSRADVFLDSSSEHWHRRVQEETDGRGADKVIVACSSGRAQEEALQLVSKRGRVSYFGFTSKDTPWIKFDSNSCHYREYFVTGAFAYPRRQFKLALDLVTRGTVKAEGLVTHVYPLDQLARGMETMRQGLGLKIVIDPSKTAS
jgi:L-iditol 2-dehydrogenase